MTVVVGVFAATIPAAVPPATAMVATAIPTFWITVAPLIAVPNHLSKMEV